MCYNLVIKFREIIMFIFEKIPNVKIASIVNGIPNNVLQRMPETLPEFCQGLQENPYFYSHHTNIWIGSKTVQKFHSQIMKYLESAEAVKYSVEDSLNAACIESPLGITYMSHPNKTLKPPFKVKDISALYDLTSDKLRLPTHHVAYVTKTGKVPESVAVILRKYIAYALKCEDKDFNELQKELELLTNSKVLTEEFYAELSGETPQNQLQ